MFHLFGGRISRVLAQTASKEASKEAPFKASIRGASAIGYRPLELLKVGGEIPQFLEHANIIHRFSMG